MAEVEEDNGSAVFTALSLVFLFIVGLGLGSTSTMEDFKHALSKPKAIAIGFFSQYLAMPLIAYILCLIFSVRDGIAIGIVLVGASPGGTTSNIFTYWSLGDVSLSITMSCCSTLAAFFMMPIWILILVRGAFNSNADIAWTNMIAALLLIIVPTALGLAIRDRNTEYKIGDKFLWQWIESLTSFFGILFLIAALVSSLVIYGEDIKKIKATVWVIALIMQPLGCLFGFHVSRALGMKCKDNRTISLETGVQNFTLTMAVINLTFKGQLQKDVLMFSLAYGLLYFANSTLLVSFFRWYLAPLDNDDDDDDDKQEIAKKSAKAVDVEEGVGEETTAIALTELSQA